MATSSSEPPPKHVKFRYRALAYVRQIGRHPARPSRRSFAIASEACPTNQIYSQQRQVSDLDGAHPTNQRDPSGPRPIVRIGSRKSFADSTGSKSRVKVITRRSNLDSNEVASGGIKVKTRSRRGRKKLLKTRDNPEKRRHRLMASIHDHGGHRFRLFCRCCAEEKELDPGEPPSFHWGVGFDDSYFLSLSNRRLSNGTRFRLGLCGLHVATHNKERADSCDSGRALPTRLDLRSRDGDKFVVDTGNSGISSTGVKRKTPSPSYPSYTPTPPSSPFMNDFLPIDSFNNTRVRSRVSVGCNGWFLNDNDPTVVGWYRHRSSSEGKPLRSAHLAQVAETPRESDTEFDRGSPKRCKMSPRVSRTTDGVASSPRSVSPPTISRLSCAVAELPPFVSSRNSYNSGLVPQKHDPCQVESSESENSDYEPPMERRLSTTSSSNSSGGFGFGNTSRAPVSLDEFKERGSVRIKRNVNAGRNTSLAARFNAGLRLTRSLSPRSLKKALLPRGSTRQRRRHSDSQSRRVFQLGPRTNLTKATFGTATPARAAARPSIVFIDCPP